MLGNLTCRDYEWEKFPGNLRPTAGNLRPTVPGSCVLRKTLQALLACLCGGCHFLRMSTLIEIESAVSGLPAAQQRTLLAWLQSLVEKPPQAPSRQARWEVWLQKLAERRQRGMTGKTGPPLQRIMDELRGE